MQHQRFAQQNRHHAARESDVATQAHHHIRLDASNHLDALPKCFEQTQRQKDQTGHALAAHTPKFHRLKGEAALGHPLTFHVARYAQPMHAPSGIAQRFSHSQAWENVPTRAARHDQCAVTHVRPPRIICLFSASIRSTMAMATRLSKIAEPP